MLNILVCYLLLARMTETVRVIESIINKHRTVYHLSRPEKSRMQMAGMDLLCVSYLVWFSDFPVIES